MWILIAVALLGLGAVLGGAGVRRLARWAGQAAGRWRPSVGIAAVLLILLGLLLTVRGLFVIGIPLLIAALGMAVTARRRSGFKATATAGTADMSEAEARAMLGVTPTATKTEIKEAYRRLMRRAHPDLGGTSGLASQLNAARKRLLG